MDWTPERGRHRDPAGRPREVLVILLVILLAAVVGIALGLSAMGDWGAPPPDPSRLVPKKLTGYGPLPRSEPSMIEIPAIGVRAPVSPLDLDANGEVAVPPIEERNITGWYRRGPTPGEYGPAVILGHVDTGQSGPAVFFHLRQLRRGQMIEVGRRDGKVAAFTVDSVEQTSKDDFPTDRVYRAGTTTASLRLVTCGGRWDARRQDYQDNVIVFATFAGSRSR